LIDGSGKGFFKYKSNTYIIEDYCLLEGGAKFPDRPVPTFQKTVLLPFLGQWFHIHHLKISDATF